MKTVIDKNTKQVKYHTVKYDIQLSDDEELVDFIPDNEVTEIKIVTDEVPLWSMRNILRKKEMFDDILTAINTLSEPTRTDALDYLEYGNFIERNSNTVLLIQQIKQLSNDEVDDLFIECANLKL